MLINRNYGQARKYSRKALAGLQIPTILVPTMRAALQSQGIDPNMLSPAGDLDPQALFAMAFDKVDFKTNVTDTITIDMTRAGTGQVSKTVRELQPVVTLRGRAGVVKIAPAGEGGATRNLTGAGLQAGLGIGAALLGLIFIGKQFI